MAWVYILKSASGRFYIGSTTDLERRLAQHRAGLTHSTKRLGGSLELAASLELETLEEACELERLMKKKKNPRIALMLLDQRRRENCG